MKPPHSDLRFTHRVSVRFRDIDIGGHAHHSEALIYFEEARAAYWREVAGKPGLEDIDYVLAEATVRFKKRVLYPNELTVSAGVVKLGKKHFEMAYEVRGGDGEVLITGSTVQVMFDYETGIAKRISNDLRSRIEQRDGPFESSGGRA